MDLQDMIDGVLVGNRRALARAITLVESGRDDHREKAVALLDALRKSGREALRIGLSGTPGVGKSTFIETFGMMLTGQGLRLAVLAVDPSSTRSGGSILGDKTRMERLTRAPGAFIRPSPSQSALGGVARRTREVIALCEAAGFDVVIVETVGVGQSEVMVSEMTDLFVLLLAPAGGDELQGVKRGIMEIADLILVNKADGDLKPAAVRTCADYAGALRLMRKRAGDPDGYPRAMTVSAVEEIGLGEAWEAMGVLRDWRRGEGFWGATRRTQAELWFERAVEAGWLARLGSEPRLRALRADLRARVAAGEIAAEAAAARMLGAAD
ncbi:MAG: methylmalonyl Co-A mutase-associated GTPase MeaB [Pseudomonadota bacterium]